MDALKKLDLLDTAIRAASFPLASVAIYSEILDRVDELGATPEMQIVDFRSLREKEDCLEKRIKRLAAAGVIEIELKPLRVVWVYHPIPERRTARPKPAPLFEGIEDVDEQEISAEKSTDKTADNLSVVTDKSTDNLSVAENEPKTLLYPRTDACAPAGVTSFSLRKERKKEAILKSNFEYAAERRRIVEILVAPNDWSTASELIDRVIEGRRQNVAGLSDADLKRIRRQADEAVRLYERTDGARGKRYRWMIESAEIGQRFKAAGCPWESFGPAPTPEPPPESVEAACLSRIAQLPPIREPTFAELERDSRGETIPDGETLQQTARRLGITPAEAVFIRKASTLLQQRKGQDVARAG